MWAICAAAIATVSTAGATAGATMIGGGDDPALRHIVLGKKTVDSIGPLLEHEWDFYFAGDPSKHYPLFGFHSSDHSPSDAITNIFANFPFLKFFKDVEFDFHGPIWSPGSSRCPVPEPMTAALLAAGLALLATRRPA
jgi:hypothetical protein